MKKFFSLLLAMALIVAAVFRLIAFRLHRIQAMIWAQGSTTATLIINMTVLQKRFI